MLELEQILQEYLNKCISNALDALAACNLNTEDNCNAINQNKPYAVSIARVLSYLQNANILHQGNFDKIIQNAQHAYDIAEELSHYQTLTQDDFNRIIQNNIHESPTISLH